MVHCHYLDRNWVQTKDLKVSAFDLVVSRGFGCFDFLRTYEGKPFLLKEHIDRLFNSARILGLKIPAAKQEIAAIVTQGLKKNKLLEANIKIIVTGGPTEDSITPSGKPSVIITFTPAYEYPRASYEKGVRLITCPAGRLFPEAKSLNYLAGVVAMVKANREKAEEALYVDNNKIYETTRCNFFAVVNGRLVTVKKGILRGITRNVVIKLAERAGITVVERDLLIKEIPRFQEAFITASNKEIMPVIKIDDKMINIGKVGQVTRQLMAEFYKITRGKLKINS